jgi:uncharacterized membrane protein YdjX (TVP38/TMEM64 family)
MGWRHVLVGVAIVTGFTAVVLSDAAHAGLLWVLDVTEPVIADWPVMGGVVFVALAAVSAMLAFFSSVLLVPVALDAWGVPLTIVLLWVAWTLGGIGAYALGRYLGYPVVARFTSSDLLERYRQRVSAHASFGVVLLFQLALSSEVPGYVLGLARYPLVRYASALALAEIPYAVLTVYIGAGLVERRLALLFGAAAAVLLVSGLAFLVFRRWLRA